ncbi:MAG: hypothetical protein AVDCRST_MAG72-23 [uncultured Nocardioidaceae bacterium]|uniref:Integral membrane protein n=1 Tax=uncultured Nocardioidaceae bacterium TaxID=253824 RepID=A0A6J4L9P1_9ACTN|nr:MAG: hypothetical protein AVDCRST_MAG72-23 [uncultured Nocardioidaceae bacterium]
MSAPAHAARTTGSALEWTLRLVTVAGLAVAAVVHLRLASDYQQAYPDGVGGGNLFRAEAAVAIVAGIYLLVRGSRLAYVVAFLVSLAALVAVVVTRYVDGPDLGPFPWMYEPIWFFEKSLSAIAEGVATVTAAIGVAVTGRRRDPAR